MRHMLAAVKPIRMIRRLLWGVPGLYIVCGKGRIDAGAGVQPDGCDIVGGGVAEVQPCCSGSGV